MTGSALPHRRVIDEQASDVYNRIGSGPAVAHDKRIIDRGLEKPDCRGSNVLGFASDTNRLLR